MEEIMVTTYRKRPVEVEGVTWDGSLESTLAVKLFVGQRDNGECRFLLTSEMQGTFDSAAYIYDEVQRGWVPVNLGDTILKGVRGEFYPIEPGVLADTYEVV